MALVRYLVDDVDAAIAFYTGQIGFTLDQRMGPAFAVVSYGDLSLWLSGPQSSAARPMPDGHRPEPGGWNRISLEVTGLPAMIETLRKSGVHFRNDLVTGIGGNQILLDDPSGNPVELFEPRAQ